jgi:hypothetical protein
LFPRDSKQRTRPFLWGRSGPLTVAQRGPGKSRLLLIPRAPLYHG